MPQVLEQAYDIHKKQIAILSRALTEIAMSDFISPTTRAIARNALTEAEAVSQQALQPWLAGPGGR